MEIIKFNNVFIDSTSVCVGPEESKSVYKDFFDKPYNDLRLGYDSFEKSEMHMQDDAIQIVFKKTKLNINSIKYAISGDLINQNVISNYTLRYYNFNVIGIYAACATSVLGLILGALIVTNTHENTLCLTSSHNATSERQFRNPNEYGGAKSETQTKTVTSACALILTKEKRKVKVKQGLIGNIIDIGFKYPDDMGRAMAPAACESIIKYLTLTNTIPSDYDLILTGDLSKYGSDIVLKILEEKYGYINNYNDCGMMIYEKNMKIYCGGSGCSCMPTIAYSYIFKMLEEGKMKRVLLCATGALMNQTMTLQRESIPAICHIIELEGYNDLS